LLFQETIIDGLDNAADTFLAMLGGEGIGKRLIRL
jgi:NADPH-dependent curcumin reductase CurA